VSGAGAPEGGAVRVREYISADAAALAGIFYRSVRGLGPRHYSDRQVEAWAPGVPDAAAIDARCRDGRLTLVAVDTTETPVAYAELESDGHIDHLYCAPEFAGTGLMGELYQELEQTARAWGLTRLYTEASEAARLFLERRGFHSGGRRDFVLRGVMIHNYAMDKRLTQGIP